MGGEDHLVLGRQTIQDGPAHLLETGMQEDLRILDHDDTGQVLLDLCIRFQKGEQVDGPHSLPHVGNGPRHILGRMTDLGRHLQDLLHIPVHEIQDLLPPAVLVKTVVDLVGKSVQVQLVQLIIQQFGDLHGIQLGRTLLLN